MKATQLWSLWQAILLSIAIGFGRDRGKQRFVQWATGLALNVEEHTLIPSLIVLDAVGDGKALEANAFLRQLGLPLAPRGRGAPPGAPVVQRLAYLFPYLSGSKA
jgi:hypothetical protein